MVVRGRSSAMGRFGLMCGSRRGPQPSTVHSDGRQLSVTRVMSPVVEHDVLSGRVRIEAEAVDQALDEQARTALFSGLDSSHPGPAYGVLALLDAPDVV